jgi:hypothetical protein
MKELFRILNKGGYCIIQTPFNKGEIVEDDSIKASLDRETYFGQYDHVRIYSVDALKCRLEKIGFKVDLRNFREDADNINGFNEEEVVLVCCKPMC